jgi:hypothetical protein
VHAAQADGLYSRRTLAGSTLRGKVGLHKVERHVTRPATVFMAPAKDAERLSREERNHKGPRSLRHSPRCLMCCLESSVPCGSSSMLLMLQTRLVQVCLAAQILRHGQVQGWYIQRCRCNTHEPLYL